MDPEQYAVNRLCMIKLKPWKIKDDMPLIDRKQQRIHLNRVVRKISKPNSISIHPLTPNPPKKIRFKKKRFPFLQRNLHRAVKKWPNYEKRFNEWRARMNKASSPKNNAQRVFLLEEDEDKENSHPIRTDKNPNETSGYSSAKIRSLGESGYSYINKPTRQDRNSLSPMSIMSGVSSINSRSEKRLSHDSAKRRVSLTRSGRVVKPPLASWAGQRIVYDIDGNPIEARGIKTTTMHADDAPEDEMNRICNELGLKAPPKPSFHQGPILSAQKSSNNRRSFKMNSRPLVPYSDSEDDRMSIDNVSLSSLSSPSVNVSPQQTLTPIHPGRVYLPKKFIDIFKSSDNDTPVRVIKTEKKQARARIKTKKELKVKREVKTEKHTKAKRRRRKPRLSLPKRKPNKPASKKTKKASTRIDVISIDSEDSELSDNQLDEVMETDSGEEYSISSRSVNPKKRRKPRLSLPRKKLQKPASKKPEKAQSRREIVSSDTEDFMTDENQEDYDNASRTSSNISADYIVEQPPDTDSEHGSSDNEIEILQSRTPEAPKVPLKTGRWNPKDKDTLKIAFRALPPRSMEDEARWEVYAKQLNRTVDDCKQMAQKLLLTDLNDKENEGELDDQPGPSRIVEEETVVSVTAKQGTATYALQTEKFTRSYMLNSKNDEGADFFNKISTPTNAVVSTLMEEALNDSLVINTLRTPELTAKNQRKPFIPEMVDSVNRLSSPLEIYQEPTYSNSAWTIDSTERVRQARRRQHIINETSRVGRVKFANSLSMNSTGLDGTRYGNASVVNPDGTINLPKLHRKMFNRRTTLREENEEVDEEDADDEEEEEN